MKKILLFISCSLAILMLNAQIPGLKWAKKLGGSGFDAAYDITTDASGNVYIIGGYDLSTPNWRNTYIAKFDANGNALWSKTFGSSTYDDHGTSISVDAAGNVYSTGYFLATTDFDPGTATFNMTAAGKKDIYISKLNSSGNFVWAKQIGGVEDDYAGSITVDGAGNIYYTGELTGTVDVDPGSGTMNLTGGIFISKLNVAGNFVWASKTGTSGTSVQLDGGNLYLTGGFSGTLDFDPDAATVNLTSAGSSDAFVSKYDTAFNLVWARNMGGIGADEGTSVITDASGNVYTTGSFNGTADFNPGAGTFTLLSAGNIDIFVSKLDAAGVFVWAKNMGGAAEDEATSIGVDAANNVYTLGIFKGTSDYDPGSGTYNLTSKGDYDIFISGLDATGSFAWAGSMGATNRDYGMSMVTNAAGNVFTTGVFNDTVDFDIGPGTSIIMANLWYDDIFVQKLGPCAPIDATTTLTGKTIQANQTGATYQWVDCNKNNQPIAGKTAQSYTPTVSGKYAVIVTVGGCSVISACLQVTGTGIDEHAGLNDFLIYPNPTNGIFNISNSSPTEPYSIEIYNIVGVLVYKTASLEGPNTIDLTSQTNGLYIVKVISNSNQTVTQKIIKQ